MKKYIALLTIWLLIFALAGCGTNGTSILCAPPELTVICGDQQAEAMWGTSYWWHQQSDGKMVASNYDSSSPEVVKELKEPLLLPSRSSDAKTFEAHMRWEVAPDVVAVCCGSEEIPVETTVVEDESAAANEYIVSLKNGAYLYEVIAEWNRSGLYGGTVRYSFYTEMK